LRCQSMAGFEVSPEAAASSRLGREEPLGTRYVSCLSLRIMRPWQGLVLLLLLVSCARDQPTQVVVSEPTPPGSSDSVFRPTLRFTVPPRGRLACASDDSLSRVEATVYDSAHNVDTTFNGIVTLTLGHEHPDSVRLFQQCLTCPSGTLNPVVSLRAIAGRAVFIDLILLYWAWDTPYSYSYGPALPGNYTLRATTQDGRLSAESPPFGMKGVESLQLAFVRAPRNTPAGQSLDTIRVGVYDSAMTPQPGCRTSITMNLGQHPPGTLLVGPEYEGPTMSFAPIWVRTSNGIATFPFLRLDAPGIYTLSARILGVSSEIDSKPYVVQNPVRTRGQLLIGRPSTALAGTTLIGGLLSAPEGGDGIDLAPVSVWPADSSGNTLYALYDGPVTIALAPNSSGGTLSGTLTMGAADYRYRDLRIDRPGTGYRLIASVPGLDTAASDPFDVLPAPTTDAVRLGFAISPVVGYGNPTPTAGSVLPRAKVVALTDGPGSCPPCYAFGVANSFSGPITVSLDNDSSGAMLSGTLTVNAVNGIAIFSDLIVNKAGTYVLNASAPGLAGTRTGFIVGP
jgi:hypothetical protein